MKNNKGAHMEQAVHEKFRSRVEALPPSADLALRAALGLAASPGDLWPLVAGRSHAEVTLALLSAGHLHSAGILIGRPVTRPAAPGHPQDWWTVVRRLQAELDARTATPPQPYRPGTRSGGERITAIYPLPPARGRPLTPPAWHGLLRPGATLAQVIARGAPRRAVNQAIADGWLVVAGHTGGHHVAAQQAD